MLAGVVVLVTASRSVEQLTALQAGWTGPLADPAVARLYLLLDESPAAAIAPVPGAPEQAPAGPTTAALSLLKAAFPPNSVTAVRLGQAPPTPAAQPTQEAATRLNEVMETYVSRAVVPSIEGRIRALREAQAGRRGLTDKVRKGFFSGPAQPAPVISPQQLELEARQLSELCMWLRDWEGAAGLFRSAAADLKGPERAVCEELLGLCVAMQTADSAGAPGRRAADAGEAELERALALYSKLPGAPGRGGLGVWGLRCAVLLAELYRGRGSAASALQTWTRTADRAAADPDAQLVAALLYEQASLASLPALRRFALRLLQAAERYASAPGAQAHAYRCYRAVLAVGRSAAVAESSTGIEGETVAPSPWRAVEGHARGRAGRLAALLGGREVAVAHFQLLLLNADVAPARHASVLREYLSLLPLQGAAGSAARLLPAFPFPALELASSGGISLPCGAHSSWPDLELAVTQHHQLTAKARARRARASQPSGPATGESTAATAPAPVLRAGRATAAGEQEAAVVVNEAATVELQLRNPFAVPLH
jgi:hypothetical protein